MSFHEQLKRLKDAAENRQEAGSIDKAIVNRRDLKELIYNFERIDRELRNEYYSCQKLSDRFAVERKQYEAKIAFLTDQLVKCNSLSLAPPMIVGNTSNELALNDFKIAQTDSWASIKNPPKKNMQVIVSCSCGEVKSRYVDGNFFDINYDVNLPGATHWMMVPESHNEETK